MERTGPSRRTIITWSAIMFTVLALAWFVGAWVVPVWQVRAVLRKTAPLAVINSSDNFSPDKKSLNEEILERYDPIGQLGGPRRASRSLTMYLQMPVFIRRGVLRDSVATCEWGKTVLAECEKLLRTGNQR